MAVIDFTGKRVAFMGDSITAGATSSDNAHRWTNLFCAAKGVTTQSNYGHGGWTLQSVPGSDAGLFTVAEIPVYVDGTDAAIFFFYGVNDIGRNNIFCRPNYFEIKLRWTVRVAKYKGWPAERIVLMTPCFTQPNGLNNFVGSVLVTVAADAVRVTAYNDAVKRTAAAYGTQLIDIRSAIVNSPNKDLIVPPGGDGIHPGDYGHQFISDTIAAHVFTIAGVPNLPPNGGGGGGA